MPAHLEDVQVGVELLDHALHGQQRLVEQQEAAGKMQAQRVDHVEHLMEQRGHVDVPRRHAEVAAEALLDGLGDRLVGRRAPLDSQAPQRALDARYVGVHDVQEEAHALLEVLRPQEARGTEVEEGDPSLAQVDDVGRMRIAVEEAVLQDLLEPAVGDGRREDADAPRPAARRPPGC